MLGCGIDVGAEFDASGGDVYKSCFGRSMVVNHRCNKPKSADVQQTFGGHLVPQDDYRVPTTEVLTKRRYPAENSSPEANFEKNGVNFLKRSSETTEIPMENMILQSQVETLQWQLKQTEWSREMYREVMKQIVVFLEKAHHSLELLGSKLDDNNGVSIPRVQSEHQMTTPRKMSLLNDSTLDYFQCRDATRRQQAPADEIQLDKLSREAFRLLRTAESLLNTREPNLAHVKTESADDYEFLSQLAKEFPQTKERHLQRTPSFSLTPKLLVTEKSSHPSSAFNRKWSLPLNCNDFGKLSLQMETNDELVEEPKSNRNSIRSRGGENYKCNNHKVEPEHSIPSPIGSFSTGDAESGFSSMNSSQDVGLPPVTNVTEEIDAKDTFLRSLLHEETYTARSRMSGGDMSGSSFKIKPNGDTPKCKRVDDVKLWQKPDSIPFHKRRNSTPVSAINKETSLHKVLWV